MIASVISPGLKDEFREFVSATQFPCVGAKSALATGGIQIAQARDIRSAWDDLRLHGELAAFSRSLAGGGTSKSMKSFAVLFDTPRDLGEAAFERALWERLQSLRDKDEWLSYAHDKRVAPDPASPNFAFSVGGQGYFVVGMHPGASRRSRRTPMPALIFNPYEQFEALRYAGKFTRMSEIIRRRDEAFCGSANAMLDDHGKSSAARQFSGRQISGEWVCPLANADRKA